MNAVRGSSVCGGGVSGCVSVVVVVVVVSVCGGGAPVRAVNNPPAPDSPCGCQLPLVKARGSLIHAVRGSSVGVGCGGGVSVGCVSVVVVVVVVSVCGGGVSV